METKIQSKADAAMYLMRILQNVLLVEIEKADKIRNFKEHNFEEAANCRAREKELLQTIPKRELIELVFEMAFD